MPDFSVFCKEPPAQRCKACGSPAPEDDEQCPDCGYYAFGYDLGESPDDEMNVDEDVEISHALEQVAPRLLVTSPSVATLLRRLLPRDAIVYGWWVNDGPDMCAAWSSSRGWFATVTRMQTDGTWEDDPRSVVRGALRRMVGPFSSVRTLAMSVRYDEYGKLGGLPPAEAGAILWGVLQLLDERERQIVHDWVTTRSRLVKGRKHPPATGIELP